MPADAYRIFSEAARVAELVHLKLLMLHLTLHEGPPSDAVQQLRNHLATFQQAPGESNSPNEQSSHM